MAGDRAHPGVESVAIGIAIRPEPLLGLGLPADPIAPQQPAQAVVTQAVGFLGRPAPQDLKQVRALSLERLRELAQVVQRKPKGNPPLEPGLTSQRHGKKPALRRRAPEVLHPHRRHIQAVINQRVPLGPIGVAGVGLAPVTKKIRVAHRRSYRR